MSRPMSSSAKRYREYLSCEYILRKRSGKEKGTVPMCGYACIGCGKCGKPRTLTLSLRCLACGAENAPDTRACRVCGYQFAPGIARQDGTSIPALQNLKKPVP
jgi:hypothetical protein